MSLDKKMDNPEINDPMRNDLVLERIFWFCDVPLLKSIRLVSKKWKDLSIKSWRDKAVISVHVRSNPDAIPNFGAFLNLMDSEEEDESSLELGKYPFKRYSVEFEGWNKDDEAVRQQRRVAMAIFNSRAHHVKINWKRSTLTGFDEFLSTLNSESLRYLEVIWRTLDQDISHAVEPLNFSNLKRLKLVSSLKLFNYSPNRLLWSFLLQSFPQLEALSMGYDSRESDFYPNCVMDRMNIVNLLKDIRYSSGGSLLSLKEFEMIEVNTNQHLHGSEGQEFSIVSALAECKFPLERLSIHVGWHGGKDGEMIPILPLLEASKDTLKRLKASINFNGVFISEAYQTFKGTGRVKSDLDPEKLEKICMDSLKEIQLVNGLDWAMFLLAHLKLPQLEKLIVSNETYNSGKRGLLNIGPLGLPTNLTLDSITSMIPVGHCLRRDGRYGLVSVWFPKEKIYERLRKFELHDTSKDLDPEMITKFAKMMPNLTHLAVPLDKTTFPVICQHFKGLRTLHILKGHCDDMLLELDDAALTGLSKAQLEKGGMSSSRQPNLTDLEHLSDLRISCQRQLQHDEVKLTEHSVIYGFLQLPRLYNLSVAIKDLSDDVKEQLLNHAKGVVKIQMKQKEPDAVRVPVAEFLLEQLK